MYNVESESGVKFSEDHRASIICHMIRYGISNIRIVSNGTNVRGLIDSYDLIILVKNETVLGNVIQDNPYETAQNGIFAVLHPKLIHIKIPPDILEIFNLNDAFNIWGRWKDCLEGAVKSVECTDWEAACRAIRSQLLGGLDEKILSNQTQVNVLEKELQMIDNSTHQLRTLILEHKRELERLERLKGDETPETRKMIDKTIDEIMQLRKSGAFIDIRFTATAVEAVTGDIYIHNTPALSGRGAGSDGIGWYAMGRYRIAMPYNGRTPSITLLEESNHSRCSDTQYPHPHVAGGGSPCLGNLGTPLKKFLQAGEYALALSALYEFLGTWSHKNPYMSLEAGWEKVDPPEKEHVEKEKEEKTKENPNGDGVPAPTQRRASRVT